YKPAVEQVPVEMAEPQSADVPPESLAQGFGMPLANQHKFQALADTEQLKLFVRPSNPETTAWLERGALPKPQDIKAKTINEIDPWLGADANNRGLVGFFEPTLLERSTEIDAVPGLWQRIEARFHQRAKEYDQLSNKMARMAQQDRFHVRAGVVHGYT